MVRPSSTLYRAAGEIQDGTFSGRWHFGPGLYRDARYNHFGNLQVFNDDTMSPGATWPLHPHSQYEVVTYVVEGEFRHEDEHGKGGVIRQGGTQHTTVGSGMYHAEINNRKDVPLRFVQIWYMPERLNMEPSVEQREVNRADRTNRWVPLVSSSYPNTLRLRADGAVLSSFLQPGHTINHQVEAGHGLYLYVLGGGPIHVGDKRLDTLDAAEIVGQGTAGAMAENETELLLLEVNLNKGWPTM
jgi:quercetin 2,3-dioxygenase